MTREPDYYATLQVDRNADPDVIDAAYRRLATKYHPDVNSRGDATKRMQEINEAHSVLSNPARRADYDRSRSRVGKPQVQDSSSPSAWGQVGRLLFWFLGLTLLGEAYQRIGGRGVVVLLIFAGLVWLLWKSKKWF
jgi:DnaJ-class molecular chaperone